MLVEKRCASYEKVDSAVIKRRIENAIVEMKIDGVDVAKLMSSVMNSLYDKIRTQIIDDLIAETAALMVDNHPDYDRLAVFITVSKLHKETEKNFSDVTEALFRAGILSEKYYLVAKEYSSKYKLDNELTFTNDYKYDYFGLKTLMTSFLLKVDDKIVERPQHMLMRVALGMHLDDPLDCLETYDALSAKYYTHGSPTLFNMGTKNQQVASCFLLNLENGGIEEIFDVAEKCTLITRSAGGVGLNLNNISGRDWMLCLQLLNVCVSHTGQTSGSKRPGGIAIYVEPWHVNILEFLNLKTNFGDEGRRARNLFCALWVPDLFMKKVENDEDWCLFDPVKCKNLNSCYGKVFEKRYAECENQKLYSKKMPARKLFQLIYKVQSETGGPYILYKDAANEKNNQKHLGVLTNSNLCTEIMEFCSQEEIAVCNLASVSLPSFVQDDFFDFELLRKVVGLITRNLNSVIDANDYIISESKSSNLKHRPIGIGVQGLADTFALLSIPYQTQAARELNKQIFETIYYGALEESCSLAKLRGPYVSYKGSPVSDGFLQFDMWENGEPSTLWDWTTLRAKIKKYGLRNSLLTTVMPTATTAQILGNQESVEPFVSNFFSRSVTAGEFPVVNKYLINKLISLDLWNEDTKNEILRNEGSIQTIEKIPDDLKELFRTTWEIPQKVLIDMAADRAPYIDQSQSLNIYIQSPNYGNFSSMHFYGWKKGLKTGMYYLRQKSDRKTESFTVPLEPCISCAL